LADPTAKDRINALPPEVLQHIMGSTLQGSLDEQLRTISNMAETNHNFRSQLTSPGPLQTRHQQLLGLLAIRTQHPRESRELAGPYARRLGLANVRPEDATLLVFGRVDPQLTGRLRAHLEFQPAEVRDRIDTLRTQHPREQGELAAPYARRLALANVTPEDAALLAFGKANHQLTDRLRTYLEFQPVEVQARIATLRTQHPRELRELEQAYARRLGLANVRPEDATLLVFGRVDPQLTGRLREHLEFQPAGVQTRIATLRTQHPREQGELADPYARRLGLANVTPEDATLLAFGEANHQLTEQLSRERSIRSEGRQDLGERPVRIDGASAAAHNRGFEQRERNSLGL
jgi:hypothetical protein